MRHSDETRLGEHGLSPFGRLVLVWLGAALIVATLLGAIPARAGDVLVFAAASQRDALDAVIAAYQETSKDTVKASYQSSSTLARQIEHGAPADLYISANPKWMDYLAERRLIDTATRVDMFGNGLVLIAAKSREARKLNLKTGFDLAGLIGDGRLATGDPDHVPAGIYAKQALQNLRQWTRVETKLARADNARVALALVARGEAPYGIVYSSDAIADKTIEIVATFPAASHSKIVYPVAVTTAAPNPAGAKALLDFLRSPKAAKIYRQFGFSVLGTATN